MQNHTKNHILFKEQKVILISAYNEYRKSAKKTAYKTDLLQLHKGWLAFGVELDSYCERDTLPVAASIQNVGMRSLVSSKLYGNLQPAQAGVCAGTPLACTNSRRVGQTCTVATDCDAPATTGPGKINLIGFTAVDANCQAVIPPATTPSTLLVTATAIRDATSTADPDCELTVTSYKMGVWGHISGNTFIGNEIDHNGVIRESSEGVAADFGTTCT